MKISRKFTEGIARLDLEGIPDQSLGHDQNTIGILMNWRLDLIGLSVLEGKIENLVNLIYVISTYSRYCISGIYKPVNDESGSISLSNESNFHKLKLISTKSNIKPLTLELDDAELADLTKCLDKVTNDTNLAIQWNIPNSKKLFRSQLISNLYDPIRIIYPITGLAIFSLTVLLFYNYPRSIQPETTVGSSVLPSRSENKID
ncbi:MULTISPECIES: DUF4335 domain-containing protein [unclassified Prochlorococcus]|uniref:DUF4335 domain-containing protein n=1 Tax=unclassified Prochlorococcus TaxID=2627481 RepID=UPI000533B61B|nr:MULTISPECIES: DUF4335 domain-containing protein [unclassified Prochlorococcus]KGG15228.1 hypothetical protein EV06_1097 [Prochlorococcus sp. MIT 0602]KGG17503.1 hypothetical protein EV07_0943 [Prochlorococcus sp. MIT 0603]